MKRPLLLLLLFTFIFCSCDREDDLTSDTFNQKDTDVKNFNPVVTLPSKSLGYDYSSPRKNDTTSKNTRLATKQAVSTITSDQIVVTYPQYTFLGSLLNAKTVDDGSYKPAPFRLKPIDISFSFPSDFVIGTIERPSLSAMRAAVNKATRSAYFSGEQSLSFEYDIKQFSKYEEVKFAFGGNVNVSNIFKLEFSGSDHNISKKTGVFAKFIQRNFTADMDIPFDGNIFLNNSDLQNSQSHNPIYINSITYGRLGILALESDYTYDEVLFALKAAFSAEIVNGELNIDSKNLEVLQKSSLKTYVLGGKGQDAVQLVNGFKGFSDFITNGGEFTANTPGVPIYFSASHASDNSVFFTEFNVE